MLPKAVEQERNDSDNTPTINQTKSSGATSDIAKPPARPNRKFYQRKRLISSVVFFLLAGVAIFLLGKYTEYRSYPVNYREHSTVQGQQSTVTLSDGSQVMLHNDAILRYPESFKGFKREVHLYGEAFFEIQKDSLRPFIIHTRELRTLVMGSSLHVKATHASTTVSVDDGSVQVMAGDDMQIVLPNEKISYSHATKKMMKTKADRISWRTENN